MLYRGGVRLRLFGADHAAMVAHDGALSKALCDDSARFQLVRSRGPGASTLEKTIACLNGASASSLPFSGHSLQYR